MSCDVGLFREGELSAALTRLCMNHALGVLADEEKLLLTEVLRNLNRGLDKKHADLGSQVKEVASLVRARGNPS